MNTAEKKYTSKKAAVRALRAKVNFLHANGTSGEANFARIYVEGNTLYATSSYWNSCTLQEFLDGKRKLEQ